MRKLQDVLALLVPVLFLVGCTWVQLTPAGEKVVVLSPEEVAECKRVGQATVSVLSKVGIVERGEQAVQDELRLLARNSGAEIGGDAVVPESEVADGKQRFGVYKCRP